MTTNPVCGLRLAVLLAGLATGPAARGQNCDPGTCPPRVIYHAEGPPRIKFKYDCPRPVCDPCDLRNFGYFQTGWRQWPGPAGSAHTAVPPRRLREQAAVGEARKGTAPAPIPPEVTETPRYLPPDVPVSKPVEKVIRPISSKEAGPPAVQKEPERAAPPTPPGFVPPVPTELPEDLKPVSYNPPAARPAEPPAVKAPEATERGPARTKAGPPAGGPPLKMVNSRRISLDYDPSDLRGANTTLELWYTRDGRNWDRDGASGKAGAPYVVEVDREGTYGFLMVARAAGEKSVPPAAGAAPQVWVEVDWTRPVVQLIDVRPGADRKLSLLWTANDNNLGRQPITLSYAARPEGPWKSFAAGLDNAGRFTWQVPGGLPAQVYLKVEAFDLVGNVAAAVTPEPVQLP